MTDYFYFLEDYETPEGAPVTARPFYVSDDLVAVLVTLQPGARVPDHKHAHHDEVFDVIRGTGVFFVEGEAHTLGPGMTVIAPAGVQHGLLAGDELWVLRETVHRHVYARKALGRALRKRLKRVLK